jgi:hypothetical protein
MKKIIISYWCGYNYTDINIDHNSEFEYSDKKRNEILDVFLGHGHYTMLKQKDDTLYIYVDDRRFSQR